MIAPTDDNLRRACATEPLVRADTRLPESGVEKYFRQTPAAGPLPPDRETFERLARREQQRVYSYDNWNRIYACAFGGGADDADRVSPLIPNDETIAAIEAARRGELVAVGSIDRLMEDLNAND